MDASINVTGMFLCHVRLTGCLRPVASINSSMYSDEVFGSNKRESLLEPHLKKLHEGVFQQDGARCHTSRSMNWLKGNKINVLNPHRTLTSSNFFGREWQTTSASGGGACCEELVAMVKDEWEKIPQAEVDHLVGEEYRKRTKFSDFTRKIGRAFQ